MPETSHLTSDAPDASAQSLETIRTLGRLLDDLERVRIMNSNRIGALERQFGEAIPHLVEISDPLQQAEHLAELELVRTWRKHPLAPWAKAVRGLGEKSVARLIAEIGDPAIGTTGHWEVSKNGATQEGESDTSDAPEITAMPEAEDQTVDAEDAQKDRRWVIDEAFERTVSQLWAYAGVGDPARNRIPKGATQSELMRRGKPRAKKQLYLIGTGMLKAGVRRNEEGESYAISPWGQLYLDAREKYSTRIHTDACPPCHAQAGDAWRPGHQHMAALRIVEKEFLKELWKEARRLKGLEVV